MTVTELELSGVLLIEPRVHTDERGSFLESWNQQRYAQAGMEVDFVQDNLSRSRHGVLRGLHYQQPNGQAKLTSVLYGEVWDVVVDIRRGSPTFARWVGTHLSAENGRQLFIPEGFAHGFAVLSQEAVFSYKCGRYYDRESEWTIRWDDPSIGIDWPVADPVLSRKDCEGWLLRDLPANALPEMRERPVVKLA